MNLRECIEEIRRQKKWVKQEFAAAVKIDKTVMSKLGVRWDEHWQVFLRILDLCDEVGIDPRADAGKATNMTARELEERLVSILERLLLQEKPRPQREFLRIAKRGHDRAEKRRGEQSIIVSGVSGETENNPRKNTGR